MNRENKGQKYRVSKVRV